MVVTELLLARLHYLQLQLFGLVPLAKGAFNGVSKESIDTRLRQKGIPSTGRNWIRSNTPILRQGTAVFVIEAERFGTLAGAKPPELPERQRCNVIR
jgi:hypothetical protein